MKTIPELVAQIKKFEVAAQVDLAAWDDPRSYPGAATQKAEAQTYLPVLRKELREVIAQNSRAVFVSGPGAAKFAEIAEDEGPAIIVNADEIYERITQVAKTGLGPNGEFRVDVSMRIMDGLRIVAQPLGIWFMPPLDLQPLTQRLFTSDDTLKAAIREVIRKAVEDELNAIYLNDRITQEVIDGDCELSTLFVVVTGATEEEIGGDLGKRLCGGRTIAVTAPENAGKNEVLVAYRKLFPETVKKKKDTTTEAR